MLEDSPHSRGSGESAQGTAAADDALGQRGPDSTCFASPDGSHPEVVTRGRQATGTEHLRA
jgi:hypothetical protein